jgi:hypothetical protein
VREHRHRIAGIFGGNNANNRNAVFRARLQRAFFIFVPFFAGLERKIFPECFGVKGSPHRVTLRISRRFRPGMSPPLSPIGT